MPGRQQPRVRHVPQRTCVACRTERSKRELVRIVRTADGSIKVDQTGKMSGRGAYLCVDPACWRKVVSGHALDGALKTTVTEQDRELLRTYVVALEDTTIPQAPATPPRQGNKRAPSTVADLRSS